MSIYKKLLAVQAELKAPKSQRNTFGNYNYRSCEDILEAVKPILKKHSCLILLNDKILLTGERYYLEATATFVDLESESNIETTALAREPEQKKGMDSSQVTGAASSYARKYALNALLCIDDTKDSDRDEEEMLVIAIEAIDKIAIKKGIQTFKIIELSKKIIGSDYLKENDLDKLKELHNYIKNIPKQIQKTNVNKVGDMFE